MATPTVPTEHSSPDAPAAAPGGWSIAAAKALYNIEGWGAGFFDVSDRGHVVVRPDPEHPDREIDLYQMDLPVRMFRIEIGRAHV